jgi:enoyl-CoA hydratase
MVMELATSIAGKSREALTRTKRLVYDGLRLPLADGTALEIETVLEHLAGTGAGEGIDRFVRSEKAGS